MKQFHNNQNPCLKISPNRPFNLINRSQSLPVSKYRAVRRITWGSLVCLLVVVLMSACRGESAVTNAPPPTPIATDTPSPIAVLAGDHTPHSWSYETEGRVTSAPTVVDGTLFFGSTDQYIYALTELSGELQWSYKTSGAVYSSPILADGAIFVGTEDGSVYALDSATGDFRWDYKTGGPIYSSPAVANEVLYVGSKDGYLHALDAAGGGFLWKYQTEGEIHFPAIVTEGTVTVGSGDGHVYNLDAATGNLLWKYQTGGVISRFPEAYNEVLYIGSSDIETPKVSALDVTNGELLWVYEFRSGWGSPHCTATADGVVYVGWGSYVHALDAYSGKSLWAYEISGSASRPAVVGGVVYIGTRNPANVYALSVETGDLLWRYEADSDVWSVHAASNDVIYLSREDGYVHVLITATAALEHSAVDP